MGSLSSARNRSDVYGRRGSTRGCGDVSTDGGTGHRSGPGEMRGCQSSSSVQTRISNDRSRVGNKRPHQTTSHSLVPPTQIKTPVDDSHTPMEYGSISEPGNAAVKAEVAVSSKADPMGTSRVEAAAREWAAPTEDVEDGACAEPDGAVKTEVGIAFSSKRAAAGG